MSQKGSSGPVSPTRSRLSVTVWGIVTLLLAVVLAYTAPVKALMGQSEFAAIGTTHGIFATLGVLFGSATGYLGWRLFSGKLRAYDDLRWLAVISTILSITTIMFGNWIYIAYRGPGGPREYFLSNFPAVHEVFFEFKEFIALFTLPIAVASTYILWTYKDRITGDGEMRVATGVLIAVGWSVLMIAFLLGAAITKLMSV